MAEGCWIQISFISHYGLVSKFWTPHFLSISVPREKDKDILHKSVDSGGPGLVVTFVSTNPQMASKTVP